MQTTLKTRQVLLLWEESEMEALGQDLNERQAAMRGFSPVAQKEVEEP